MTFYKYVPLILFLIINISCQHTTPKQNIQIYHQLSELKKYDVLLDVLLNDLIAAKKSNDVSQQLEINLMLAEIYTYHMIDFNNSLAYCRKAAVLNDKLKGKKYSNTSDKLNSFENYIKVQKGLQTNPIDYTDNPRRMNLIDKAFSYNELTQTEKIVLINKSEDIMSSDGEFSRNDVRLIAAGIVASAQYGKIEAGHSFIQKLQELVKNKEKEILRQATIFEKEAQKNKNRFLKNIAKTTYSVIAIASVAVLTAGTIFFDKNEMAVARQWWGSESSDLKRSSAIYARSKTFARESEFARGLNIFLNYHEQIKFYNAAGKIMTNKNLYKEGINYLSQGIDLIEIIRKTIFSESDRMAYFALRNDLYDQIIYLLMENGDIEKSLLYSERARSRAFLDVLASGNLEFKNNQEANQYATIRDRQAEVSSMLNNTMLADAQVDYLNSKIRGIRVASSNNTNFSEIGNLSSITVPDIKKTQKDLPEGTTFLSYYISENNVFGWSITKETIKGKKLSILTSSAKRLCFEYLQKCKSPEKSIAEIDLFNNLILPFEDYFTGTKLIIVPHRFLHHFPFASLLSKDGYLIQKYSLTYSPSISVWNLLNERKVHKPNTLLAIGPKIQSSVWPMLPGAEIEIQKISKVYEHSLLLAGSSVEKTEWFLAVSSG